MTQIYRINAETLKSKGREETELVITNWSHTIPSIVFAQGMVDRDSFVPTHRCYGFAAIYRKNGANFLWRGSGGVKDKVQLRIADSIMSGEVEGDILLYKSSSFHRYDKRYNFPIRLSDNRYAILTGSLNGLRGWIREDEAASPIDDRSIFSPAYDMLYNVWSMEHLVDRHLGDRSYGNMFTDRAKLIYLLDQHLNGADFKDLSDIYCNDEVPRATYCVWKDGQFVEWHRYGQNLHPKI